MSTEQPGASGQPGPSELDTALVQTPRADDPATFDTELGAGWRIGGGINGGLLLAVLGQSLRHRLPDHPDPLSISAYYLTAGRAGPATISTEVLRTGRTVASAQASLVQAEGGRPVERIRALATYGDLAALPDGVRTTAEPPELPPPDECVRTNHAPPEFLEHAALLERLDIRLDPATAGWAVGEPSGRGRISGWLRMADGREPDTLMLLLALDALPPVTFDLGLMGWAPTLELTAHVRAAPAPGWLRLTHATRNHAGGMLEEDAEVWDSTGRLVAQSRQLAMAPRSR